MSTIAEQPLPMSNDEVLSVEQSLPLTSEDEIPSVQQPLPLLSDEVLSEEARRYAAQIVQQKRDATRTGDTYVRHQQNYIKFIEGKNCCALPVTPAKVVMFIRNERERSQMAKGRSNEGGVRAIKEGTNMGKSSIVQAITALESLRKETAHQFEAIPLAQLQLRQSHEIRIVESDAKAKEGDRYDNANALKATGSFADCETINERRMVSQHFLKSLTISATPAMMLRAIRNRSMYLVAGAYTYRGDNTRPIALSDIQIHEFSTHMPTEKKIKTTIIVSENGKTNKTGRQDQTGAIRHVDVMVCPVGGIALTLFAKYHIANEEYPEFAPDFSKPGAGKYGVRDWYKHLLYTAGQHDKPMTYQNHYDIIKRTYRALSIDLTKVTHAGRVFGARTAALGGVDASDGKAQGLWEQGSYRSCYNTTVPMPCLKSLAGTHKDAVYYVPRSLVEPPPALERTIFPWVESELEKYNLRKSQRAEAVDIALKAFLSFLQYARKVLLQDIPYLIQNDANGNCLCPALSNLPLFKTPEFLAWAHDLITTTESLQTPPAPLGTEDFVQAVVPIISEMELRRERDQTEMKLQMERNQKELKSQMEEMQRFLTSNFHGRNDGSTLAPIANNESAVGVIDAVDESGPANVKVEKKRVLEVKYGARLDGIELVWVEAKGEGDWIPKYELAKVNWVEEVWREYNDGVNGKISVRELDEDWGTRWRFAENRIRVDYNRRMEVVKEVRRLRAFPGWNLTLALQDLGMRYTNRKIRLRKATDDLRKLRMEREQDCMDVGE